MCVCVVSVVHLAVVLNFFTMPQNWEWSQYNSSNPAFIAAVADLNAALDAAEAVGAPFDLATSGWVVGPLPDRAIFDKVRAVDCVPRPLSGEI